MHLRKSINRVLILFNWSSALPGNWAEAFESICRALNLVRWGRYNSITVLRICKRSVRLNTEARKEFAMFRVKSRGVGQQNGVRYSIARCTEWVSATSAVNSARRKNARCALEERPRCLSNWQEASFSHSSPTYFVWRGKTANYAWEIQRRLNSLSLTSCSKNSLLVCARYWARIPSKELLAFKECHSLGSFWKIKFARFKIIGVIETHPQFQHCKCNKIL